MRALIQRSEIRACKLLFKIKETQTGVVTPLRYDITGDRSWHLLSAEGVEYRPTEQPFWRFHLGWGC